MQKQNKKTTESVLVNVFLAQAEPHSLNSM